MIRSFWKLESCERKFSDLGWRIVQRHHGDPAHPTSPIYRSSCCLATERSETNTISRFRADVGAVLQADMRSGFPQPHLDFDHTDYQARGQPSPFFSDHQSPRISCQNSFERRDSKAASLGDADGFALSPQTMPRLPKGGDGIVWGCRTVSWGQPPVRRGKHRPSMVALTAAFSWRWNTDSVETVSGSAAFILHGMAYWYRRVRTCRRICRPRAEIAAAQSPLLSR